MLPLSLTVLAACTASLDTETSVPREPSLDFDLCDRAEICDGIDNDCDGEVDEGLQVRWYSDSDADGYGWGEERVGCHAPLGHAVVGGDCDDAQSTINPGAAEICDGLDNNCDGVIDADAVDRVTYYPDADQDGYGTPDQVELRCTGPSGWVDRGGDCDDLDPLVFPGAQERCNQRDDDCDGQLAAAEVDDDLDGVDECGGDCEDGDDTVFPGAPEVVYDGLDNDCDPLTLDDDLDGDGFALADDCDDNDPLINPDSGSSVRFVDITAAAGLDQTQWEQSVHPPLCGYEIIAGGAAVADYDGDGFVDLYLPVLYEPDRLYRNQGDGTFVDVAPAAGLDHPGASTTGVWLDVEGDGDLDLYVLEIGVAPARLYINDGAGHFAEEALARGADMGLPLVGCAYNYSVVAADADGDGDLDLFSNQWHVHPDFVGDRSRLLLNDGMGFFSDGTGPAGIALTDRSAFSSHFADLSGDGVLDVAVAADWGESGLWLGQGDGTFTEVTAISGVGTDENGMGSDLADFDQDGDLDWFVTSIFDERMCVPAWGCTGNRLYVNDGLGNFSDGTDAAGVRDGSWGWGAAFLDVDNDGDQDIVQQNGFPTDDHFVDVPMRLFVNDGTGVYTDRACDASLDQGDQGRAVVPFDFDNDGDLDLLSTVNASAPRLLENTGAPGTWARIGLSDGLAPGNRLGIGSFIEVEAVQGGVIRRRDIHLNSNFSGVRVPEAHFGFGGHVGPLYEVRVTWPDGAQTLHTDVDTNQILVLSR